jgi:hypothetical protein
MNIQGSIKSFFALGAIIIALTVAAFGQTTAMTQRLRFASFGLQTLDAGRTARLSVVHTAPVSSRATDSPTVEPVRYAVRADFDVYSVRADGNVRFLRRVSREATLAAGDGLTLDFTQSASDGSVRVASNVYIKRVGASETEDNAASVGVSLEVRNREGTMFLLPGTIRGFNPQPDPPHELGGIFY